MAPPPVSVGGPQLAFGRYVSPTKSHVGAAFQEGEDLRFTFEVAGEGDDGVDDSVPYWQQGDAAWQSEEALAMRAALKHDARVKQALGAFWAVYDKDSDGRVSQAEYLKVHAKLCTVLIPDITAEEAARAGEEDWVSDGKGKEAMERDDVFDCLFELTDMWCTGISGEEYSTFLRKLFKRVTVKVTTKADGQVVTNNPRKPSKVRNSAARPPAPAFSPARLPAPAPPPPPSPPPHSRVPLRSTGAPVGVRLVPREPPPAQPRAHGGGGSVRAGARGAGGGAGGGAGRADGHGRRGGRRGGGGGGGGGRRGGGGGGGDD